MLRFPVSSWEHGNTQTKENWKDISLLPPCMDCCEVIMCFGYFDQPEICADSSLFLVPRFEIYFGRGCSPTFA